MLAVADGEKYVQEKTEATEKKSRRHLKMQDTHERGSEMKEQVRIIPRSSDQMPYEHG